MRDVFERLAERAARGDSGIVLSDDRGGVDCASLCASIGALAARLPPDADTVAIAGRPGVSFIVADLAATLAGRRVVPLPAFFSPQQTGHVLADARVDLVLRCDGDRRRAAVDALPELQVDGHARDSASGMPTYGGGAERVIYTSGTTGRPKGVAHGERQIAHAIAAIAAAVSASEHDRHLSALPPSLLLEQIAGVFVPLCAGARVHVPANAIESAMRGDPRGLLAAYGTIHPTTTVLVPQLLCAMVAAARGGTWVAPSTLRFVAVGGAPVPMSLLRAARDAGLPVIRGYGLSECASVVAVERPDAAIDDTEGGCGTPLPGLEITIEDGEVVVHGPTVMQGYLDRDPLLRSSWRTGDIGALTPDGALVVRGRKDRVLVLPSGRNVSADWVEAAVLADPRFGAAHLSLSAHAELEMAVRAAPAWAEWLSEAHDEYLRARLNQLMSELPDYARPLRIIFGSQEGADHPIRNIECAGAPAAPLAINESEETPLSTMRFHDRLLAETAAARDRFLAIPIIVEALAHGVSRERYLRYLGEAYHHVRHTCPLLAAAAARCGDGDGRYREALFEYIQEERGHEAWILDDIAALGGDAEAVRQGQGGDAVRVMVGYAYHAIDRISPYALLGMVHVLEGMSVALAERAAQSIGRVLGDDATTGFSYLESHGALDRDHVVFFQRLVDGIERPADQFAVIDTARVMYRLFGDVFRELQDPAGEERRHAA